LKQETHVKRRYYERFQVEDVINFFSGQLLQAKSPDGAQVFLQSIKVTRHPLPKGYQEALKKLQHPNLAPILDVMEEEDQIILVHPPFSGDPLPLIVNKERTMDPDTAVHIVHKCFKTLHDLERLPLPLSATLDPKNILLVGHKPLLLFYYIKDSKQASFDEKWRELLYYLLTGHAPMGGLKQCEKQLEEKKVPSKVAKLALQCLDRKFTQEQVAQAVHRYMASRSKEGGSGFSRKKRARKVLYTTVGVAAAALVLVTLTVAQLQSGDPSSSDPFQGVFAQDEESQIKTGDKEIVESYRFTKEKDWLTLPYTFRGVSNLRGEFVLEKLSGFTGYLEEPNKSSVFGFYVNKKGQVVLFHRIGDKMYPIGESGSNYQVKPGKKYTFEIFYFPGEPVRISLNEQGEVDKWMAVGTAPMNGELTMRFRGEDGATLYYPQLNTTDKETVEQVWMSQQPWRIGFGQAILTIDNELRSRLKVYPKTQIRMSMADANKFAFIPPDKGNPLQMELQAVDNSMYRLVWEKNDKKLALYLMQQKVAEAPIKWEPEKGEPILVTVTSEMEKLSVKVSQGTHTTEIKYTNNSAPVAVREIFLVNQRGFDLVEIKDRTNGQQEGRD
jgi:hypothetical protein